MPKSKNKVVLRKVVAKQLLKLSPKNTAHTKAIKQFARFIQKGQQAVGGNAQGADPNINPVTSEQATDGHLPCWGALIKSFEQNFTSDAARLEVFDALLASEDYRPLHLFLHSSHTRPSLMEVLCAEAGRLPVFIQRALISMPQAAPFVPDNLHHFAPAAIALWKQGQVAMCREQQLFEVRINRLLAFGYFVPDSIAPGDEPIPTTPIPDKPTEEPR